MTKRQNVPTLFESIVIISVLILYYCFSINGHIILAHCGFLIYSAYAFFKQRKQMIFKIRRSVSPFIFSAISFFITKMFATWHFNNKYGIFKENLDFSVAVWAACISCTVVLCLPLFCQSVKFACQAFHSGHTILSSAVPFIPVRAYCLLLFWVTPTKRQSNTICGCYGWMPTVIQIAT